MRSIHLGLLALVMVAVMWQSATYGAPEPARHSQPASQMHAAMDRMQERMSGMKPTGDTDRDFAMMMIPHHQAAIDMARVELKHGRDQKIRKMATSIIAAQQKEIAELQKWLKKHGGTGTKMSH